MQRNDGELAISPTLTKIGRKRLSEGKFDVTKVALSDDGVNYRLLNPNLLDPSLAVERSPMFDVWNDGTNVLKNKIYVHNDLEQHRSLFNFNLSIVRKGKERRQVQGFSNDLPVPFVIEDDDAAPFKNFQYHFTSPEEAEAEIITTIEINPEDTLLDTPRFFSVTIHDATYFDMMIRDSSVSERFSLNEIQQLRMKNWDSSFNWNLTRDENIPKTVNVWTDGQERTVRFDLKYRGNAHYKTTTGRPQIGRYGSYLSIMDEVTGQIEFIKLSLISSVSV